MSSQSTNKNSPEPAHVWPPDPLQYHVEFPYREVFYPFGLPLEVSTNHKDVLAACRQSWGRFSQTRSASTVHLRIGVSDTGVADLPRQPIAKAQRGLLILIADPENFGVLDVLRGFGFCWVTPQTLANSTFFRFYFLEVLGGCLITPVHFAIVHAACVEYRGHGFLLCGNSRAGKSTLAFACAQRGWTFIADDAGFAFRTNPDRVVIGNPLYVRLREDASKLFPQLREYAVVLRQNGEFGFEIPTDSLPGIVTGFRCHVDHIIFLNRHTAGLAMLSAFPSDLAQERLEDILHRALACKVCGRVMEQSEEMALADPEAQEEQKAAMRVLLAAPAHELRYSSLDQAVDCLESLVAMSIGSGS